MLVSANDETTMEYPSDLEQIGTIKVSTWTQTFDKTNGVVSTKDELTLKTCNPQYIEAMGNGALHPLPQGQYGSVSYNSQCLDEGQVVKFQGSLNDVSHTSLIFEFVPCDTTVKGDKCLKTAALQQERLKTIKFYVTYSH